MHIETNTSKKKCCLGRDSQDENLKSEKSDESGYVSNTKNDEEEVVNLTVHHESR